MGLLSSRIPLGDVADWCRSLAGFLKAGVTLKSAMTNLSRRGPRGARAMSHRILERLDEGDDFADAVAEEGEALPPMLLALAKVAGHTGHIPEALRELERFFRFQIRLKRKFISQITWPVIQFVAAILVIALVIVILGMIADSRGGETLDLFGLGLKGPVGAMIWIGGWVVALAGLAGGYLVAKRIGRAGVVDGLLLRIPAVGPCLSTLALARLCFAMRLTLDGGLTARKAIGLSLVSTDNGAFAELAEPMTARLRQGESLADVFSSYDLFPLEFIEVLDTGEQTGSVPEAMLRLSEQYQEKAEHQLEILNTFAGWLVWLMVAGVIVFFVFRVMLNYVKLINDLMP